jgi:hypothetical protein
MASKSNNWSTTRFCEILSKYQPFAGRAARIGYHHLQIKNGAIIRRDAVDENLNRRIGNLEHITTARDDDTFRIRTPRHDDVADALCSLRASPISLPPPSPMLTVDQLSDIVQMVVETIRPPAKDDNPLALARLEHYISQGLTVKFDRVQDKLIPWIKKCRALRANAIWREATYCTVGDITYDILTDFTKKTEPAIRSQAASRWTPKNQIKSLRQDNPDFYYPRILGLVVIRSVTDEFYTTLQNYAGIELSNDGPLLLWLTLTHFHTSTISYMARLKSDIREQSLAITYFEFYYLVYRIRHPS